MFNRLYILLYAAFAVLMVNSCVKTSDLECDSGVITITTLTAGVADSDTKTVLNPSTLKSSWLAGDAINVFFGSSVSSKFTCQTSGEIAQFKGSIDVVTGGGEGLDDDTSLWGVYPYSPNTTCDGKSVTYALPGIQDAEADTFADDLFPTIARSQNFYMSFYNLCGSFRFTVSNPDIVKVTLRGNNEEPIAGRAKIVMDVYPEVSEILDGVTEISMSASDGGCFEVGKDYYFALYPTNFTDGITITYYKEGYRASYVHTTAYELKRNKYARFRDKDKGLTFVSIPLNDWEEGDKIEDEI